MKGITPIIAIIILLLITVAIAGMGWSYINMYAGGLTANVIEVTGATCSNGQAVVFIKNSGTDPVDTSGLVVQDGQTGNDITYAVTWKNKLSDEGKLLELKLDRTGTTQEDTSGNSHSGIVMNGSAWVPIGKIGGAFSFNGNDQYIQASPGITGSPSARSFSLWFKRSDLITEKYIYVTLDQLASPGDNPNSGSGSRGRLSINGSNNLYASISSYGCARYRTTPCGGYYTAQDAGGTCYVDMGGAYIASKTLVNDMVWHHAAVVMNNYSALDISLYLDGKLESNGTGVPASCYTINTVPNPDVVTATYTPCTEMRCAPNENHIWLGRKKCASGCFSFNGNIDEARIYDRALSPAEVAELGTNSADIQPMAAATFTHTCVTGNRSSYNIISGGRSTQAYVQC